MTYKILMHSNLLPILQEESYFRKEMQKCLERLRLGYWEGGTRVKILKGVKKAVFEARVNRDLRLLFTVSSSRSAEPPHEFERYILAWDLVDHDHIDRARRMNIQPEAGFLDFEVLEEQELEVTPEMPEVALESDLEMEDFLSSPDEGVQHNEELLDSLRWYYLPPELIESDEDWQELFDENLQDLELKLTAQQAETLYDKGPTLVRGTAGSGKTTVTVYRLARHLQENPAAKILYVTYSRALLKTVETLFHDLFRARRLDLPDNMPEFLTFPDLYRKICKLESRHQVLRFSEFDHWFRTIYQQHESEFAWEEIRGIIKGACLDPKKEKLSLEEYLALGKKRAPLFNSQRPEVYQIFENYQKWLNKNDQEDDIDLARKAWRRLHKHQQYDAVICDEGQDLTEIELRFLLDLCKSPESLFFAADPQQIVNPSGFRWAELKTHLKNKTFDQRLPQIHSLSRNFRSVQSIVTLANQFINVKRQRIGRTDDDDRQEASLQGAAPFQIKDNEGELLKVLKDFGPGTAIVCGSRKDADRLSQVLDSERIFDIPNVKGLEFETVILWNMLGPQLGMWRQLLLSEEKIHEFSEAARIINYAYVGVTRARRNLLIFEDNEQARECWRSESFKSCLEEDHAEAMYHILQKPSSPDQWLSEATYYFERERYRQAAECYRRAGDEQQSDYALGHFAHQAADYSEAIELFLKCDAIEKAAESAYALKDFQQSGELYLRARLWSLAGDSFEQAESYQDAAEAYEKAQELEAMLRCRLEHHLQEHDWDAAVKILLKQNRKEEAIVYLKKLARKDRIFELEIEILRDRGEEAAAAEKLEKKKKWQHAAELYSLAGEDKKSARCLAEFYQQAGRLEEALAEWQKSDKEDKKLFCQAELYKKEKNYYEAAKIYDQLGEERQCINMLRKAKHPYAENWLDAYHHQHRGEYLESILCYERAEMYDTALELAEFVLDTKAEELEEEELQAFEETLNRSVMRNAAEYGDLDTLAEEGLNCEESFSLDLGADLADSLQAWELAAEFHIKNKNFQEAVDSLENLEHRPDKYYDLQALAEMQNSSFDSMEINFDDEDDEFF